MAIDSRIPLQVKTPDIGGGLLQFVQMKNAKEDRERQNKLLDLQTRAAESQLTEQESGAGTRALNRLAENEKARLNFGVLTASKIKNYLGNNDIESASNELVQRKTILEESGIKDTKLIADMDEMLQMLDKDPQSVLRDADEAIQMGHKLGILKSDEKDGGFTLSKDQIRYDASGNVIAKGPPGESQEDKIFGAGVTGRALQYITQMAPAYAEGKLNPDQERLFESAYTQYTQPIQYRNPDTDVLETRRPEVPAFVQQAIDRRRGTGQPEPEQQPPEKRTQEMTIWDQAPNIAGPIPAIGETVSRTPVVGGLLPAPEFTQARNFVQLAQRDLVKNLQNNPRYAEGERQSIENEIKLDPKIFDNPSAFKNRLIALDKFLDVRQKNAFETANNPRVGREERVQALNVLNGIQKFRLTLGVPPSVKNDEDYDAIPSGTRFIDPKGMERIKP